MIEIYDMKGDLIYGSEPLRFSLIGVRDDGNVTTYSSIEFVKKDWDINLVKKEGNDG